MYKAALFLLLSYSLNAYANETEIKKILLKTVPEVGQINQVSKSPIAGLYEVVTQEHLFYTDEKAQFLINGSIIDLASKRNLTEERARKLFALDFNRLPFELAVKIVKGTGERKLAVFTDPNCGFCKRLERDLQQVDNITIYQFMYPLFQGSEEKVRGVWCSKDKVKAWNDLMLKDVVPPEGKCSTPTEKVIALGKKLKVNGTPALIFSDGTINPGYMPAAELEKAFAAVAKQ